jgi:hypothetical protein
VIGGSVFQMHVSVVYLELSRKADFLQFKFCIAIRATAKCTVCRAV